MPFSKEITNFVDGLTYLKCAVCGIEALALDANQDCKKWFLHQQEQYYGELDGSNSPILLKTEAQENAKRLATVKNFLKAGSKICEVGPGSGRYAAALKSSDFEIVVVEQARISISVAEMLSSIELHNIDFEMFAEKNQILMQCVPFTS